MSAARHYTIKDNGIAQLWERKVFLNPPFGPGVEVWFSKMYKERAAGRTTEAIVLWKSATETAAWKTLTRLSCRVCFPSARIRFVMSQGNEIGPTFSPVLFYVGKGPDRFEPCTRADVDLQQRYQYVALTRASDVLIVTYSKENEFIEKMIASGDDEGK